MLPLPTNYSSARRQGWTLAELCVVIVIVVILAALLFPAIITIARSGREQQCTANIRALTLAILQYAHDHDNSVMPWHFNQAKEGESRRGTTWATWLQRNHYLPYLKDSDDATGSIYACPARRPPDRISAPRTDTLHYGYNAFPGFDSSFNAEWDDRQHYRLTKIARPSQTICIAEMNGSYRLYPNSSSDRIYPHRGGTNVSYFDGSQSWRQGPLPVVARTATEQTLPWW